MGEARTGRYAILRHDWPELHWDLFLEEGDLLASYRLLADPEQNERIPCECAVPHRKHYLDFEGELGGNRGRVDAVDRGTYSEIFTEVRNVVVELQGFRFRRTFRFIREGGQLYFSWVEGADATRPAADCD